MFTGTINENVSYGDSGKEKTQEEMITLINKDNFTEPVNKEMLFEELFKDTLEKNGISNEMFLPKYRGTWENID